MKPSERINQICHSLLSDHKASCIEHGYMCHVGKSSFMTEATVRYLDERHEIDQERRKELQGKLIDIK